MYLKKGKEKKCSDLYKGTEERRQAWATFKFSMGNEIWNMTELLIFLRTASQHVC